MWSGFQGPISLMGKLRFRGCVMCPVSQSQPPTDLNLDQWLWTWVHPLCYERCLALHITAVHRPQLDRFGLFWMPISQCLGNPLSSRATAIENKLTETPGHHHLGSIPPWCSRDSLGARLTECLCLLVPRMHVKESHLCSSRVRFSTNCAKVSTEF